MNNSYCVYKHIRLDNNIVFYIGIGKSKSRAYKKEKSARNNHWFNIVNKAGYKVELIKEGLSKDDAINLEKELILKYGRTDLKTGTLCNKTAGGEGCFNPVHVNGRKKVINIYTKAIFTSITSAAKSQNRTFNFLSNKLNSKENKSDFLFLKDYKKRINKKIKHFKYRKEQVININTLQNYHTN